MGAGAHGRPADRLVAEAETIIAAAARHEARLRLTGGLAVRRFCSDLEFMDREFSDIDLVGRAAQSARVSKAFAELGYEENRYVSHSTGGAQLQFVKRPRLLESRAHFLKRPHQLDSQILTTPTVDHVDVFLDVMRMDHDVDLRDRLEIDDLAISPVDILITKLQIGQPAEKDVHDVIALVKDLPLGESRGNAAIDLPHLAWLCSRDWGMCHDITSNLELVLARLHDYALSDEERDRVYGRLAAVREAIEDEDKPLRWRLRARVGTRLPWRREIEDREGTPLMLPGLNVPPDLG
jgi:hypothetical protein